MSMFSLWSLLISFKAFFASSIASFKVQRTSSSSPNPTSWSLRFLVQAPNGTSHSWLKVCVAIKSWIHASSGLLPHLPRTYIVNCHCKLMLVQQFEVVSYLMYNMKVILVTFYVNGEEFFFLYLIIKEQNLRHTWYITVLANQTNLFRLAEP